VAGSCALLDCREPKVLSGAWVDVIPPTIVAPRDANVTSGSSAHTAAMLVPVVAATDNDLAFDGKVRPPGLHSLIAFGWDVALRWSARGFS
jgi:hypothetical protein